MAGYNSVVADIRRNNINIWKEGGRAPATVALYLSNFLSLLRCLPNRKTWGGRDGKRAINNTFLDLTCLSEPQSECTSDFSRSWSRSVLSQLQLDSNSTNLWLPSFYEPSSLMSCCESKSWPVCKANSTTWHSVRGLSMSASAKPLLFSSSCNSSSFWFCFLACRVVRESISLAFTTIEQCYYIIITCDSRQPSAVQTEQ